MVWPKRSTLYPVGMSYSGFSASFFYNNRRELQKRLGEDQLIVLTAHGRLQRSNDTTFPYRQDSSFWYLSGVADPDYILVIDGQEEYLIAPQLSPQQAIFDGSLTHEQLTACSGIDDIQPERSGWDRLHSRLRHSKSVATCLPPERYIADSGFYTNPARTRLLQRVRATNSKISVQDIRPDLMDMRMVKQSQEIAAIERAVHVTTQTLNSLNEGGLHSYNQEYEVEAEITHGFRSRGAQHAYEPIVAGGQNATTLHYVANNQRLPENGYVLIDAGAEVDQYAADLTRTYAIGTPTREQHAIYDAVKQAHSYGLSLIKPGRTLRQNESDMVAFLGEKLKELGYIKQINSAAVRTYYPHGLSHFVGLDVHDVGDYQRPLEAGMVLTVEPGLYMSRHQVGVRIEDTVLVEEKGVRNLSQNCAYEKL